MFSFKSLFKYLLLKRRVRYAGLFLCCFIAFPTFAQSPKGHIGIALSARTSQNKFTEYTDGDVVINQEDGPINHYGLTFSWQFDNGAFFSLAAESGNGNLIWQGFDQAFQQTQYTTEYLLDDSSLHLGRNFGRYSSYIGLGHRFRERNIVGGNLYEEFIWDYAALGMNWQFQMRPHWQLRFLWELSIALQSELNVEFAGNYDAVNIETGRTATGDASIEILFKPSSKFSIGLSPIYEFSVIDEGDNYPLLQNGREIGTAHQPRTTYESLSWQLNLVKYFD
jgi:hypothetical protein